MLHYATCTRTFALVCMKHDSSFGLVLLADAAAVDDQNDNADKRQDSDHNASHTAATTTTNSKNKPHKYSVATKFEFLCRLKQD